MRTTNLVYLAGPVRSVGRDEAMFWRLQMATRLHRMGIATFNPAAAWDVPNHLTNGINDLELETSLQSINDIAVAMSNGVVVAYQGVPSVGTDREIRLAKGLRKPIVVLDLTNQARSGFAEWYKERFWCGSAGNSQLQYPFSTGDFDECAGHLWQLRPREGAL